MPKTTTFPSESPSRPSRVRHLIVALATAMSVLLYLDRFCVSFAADYIREDLGLTQTHMSWFLSVFFWSYALAQVPSGWLSDRHGARLMLTLYVVAWSLFTAQVGIVSGFVMLLLARLGCGLGQAGAYPTAGGVVSRWVPISRRGAASAWVALGGRIGGAIAPLLTAFLMVVFVPVGTPVEFMDADILDKAKLENQFSGDLPQGTKISDAAKQIMTHIGSEGTLLATLNGVLDDAGLFDEAAFAKVNLPREALSYAVRKKTGESISPDEQKRFNRLLIEAAFPAEIRKLYGRGWRPVMIVYGLVGILVAGAIWWIFRERPEQHPWVNNSERELIEAGRPPGATPIGRAGRLSMWPLLTSLSLWSNCACQFGTNVGWLFLVTWLSRYFIEVHNVPILERGVMVMIPSLAGIGGMFLGGRLTDWLLPRVGLKWSRRLPPTVTRFLAAIGYGLCLLFASLPSDSPWNSPWAFTVAFSMVYFSVDLGTAAVWAYAQDAGGKNVGSILGWGNMWGNLGAAIAPPLIYNRILGETPTLHDWNSLFWVGLIAFTLSGCCAWGLDATKPVFPNESPHQD